MNLSQIKKDAANNVPVGSGTVTELVETVEKLKKNLHTLQNSVYKEVGISTLSESLEGLVELKYGKFTEEEHPLFGTLLVNEDGEAVNVNSDTIALMEAVRILKKLENKS